MPLKHGYSQDTVSENISREVGAGKEPSHLVRPGKGTMMGGDTSMAYMSRNAEKLYKDLEDASHGALIGQPVEVVMGGGVLILVPMGDGMFNAKLMGGEGNEMMSMEGGQLPSIATQLLTNGLIQPSSEGKNRTENDDRVDLLKEEFDAQTGKFMRDKFESPYGKDMVAGEGPLDNDSGDFNDEEEGQAPEKMDLNDDGLVSDSEMEFGALPDSAKMLVEELAEKHGSEEMPQIDDAPNGGHMVKIYGADGLYYVYLMMPDNEVVHMVTTGKSRAKLGDTLEDILQKTYHKDFQNPMRIQKANMVGSDQGARSNMILDADKDRYPDWRNNQATPVVIIPDIESYGAGYDNDLTSRQKGVIADKMEELGGRVWAVKNNQDTTYAVVFEVGEKLKMFFIDRDGDMTDEGEVKREDWVMNDSRQFKSVGPTHVDLWKGGALGRSAGLNVPQTVIKKSKAVDEDFEKDLSITERHTPHEIEVMMGLHKSLKDLNKIAAKF